MTQIMNDESNHELQLSELEEKLDALSIHIPYVGQKLQSFTWIRDLSATQFEEMIFNMMNFRKQYSELMEEIEELNSED